MKKIIIFTLLGILFVSSYSCKSCNDEKNQLTRNCANGFVPNSNNTACECPPKTHMKVNKVSPSPGASDDTSASCHEKEEYVYYARVSERNCIRGLSEKLKNKNPIGIWDFYPFDNGQCWPFLLFADGPTDDAFFNETALVKHPDGSVEISFKTDYISCATCLDWSTKTDNVVGFGYGHGISNPENTKMDIEIIYKNGVGIVLDTGYIYLWKE